MMSCATSGYFGSPRGLVSCCKTYSCYPDKGEVGGSSPPRPTIQITSKYAAILTFSLFGDLPPKTVLSTVCQLYDWPDGSTLRGVKTRPNPCKTDYDNRGETKALSSYDPPGWYAPRKEHGQ